MSQVRLLGTISLYSGFPTADKKREALLGREITLMRSVGMHGDFFRVKGAHPVYAEIVRDAGDSLLMRILKYLEGDVYEEESWISRDLFETCMRTGYLSPAERPEMERLRA